MKTRFSGSKTTAPDERQQLKEQLRTAFQQMREQSYQQLVSQNKLSTVEKFEPLHDAAYYSRLVYRPQGEVAAIDLALVFVETPEQRDLFDYFRHHVSSAPQTHVAAGRVTSVLVQDAKTQTYLGLLQLSTNLLPLSGYMESVNTSSKALKSHVRNCSLNISICVPLQPFGFNYCGGKLLAMLASSTEVHQYIERKFGMRVALLVTTSLNGKSIQYDRLQQLKLVGYTQGYGVMHVPDALYKQCVLFLQKCNKLRAPKLSKHTVIKYTLQRVGLDESYLHHGQKRGIYIGYTGANARSYVRRETTSFEANQLQSCQDIFQFWLHRWALSRAAHLKKVGKFVVT